MHFLDNIMTERFIDTRISASAERGSAVMTEERKVSVLPASVIASGSDGGVLRAGTNGLVRVKTRSSGGRYIPLSVIELNKDMRVALQPNSPSINLPGITEGGAVAVGFVPSSAKREIAVGKLDETGGQDIGVIDAYHFPVRREDARLASIFMGDKEEFLNEHGIFEPVTKVEIVVGVT